jgi:protein gp37
MGQSHYEGLTRISGGRPKWVGDVNLNRAVLNAPRSWKRGRLIFVNSMSDLFHEKVPLSYIKEVFSVMEETPGHTYQVLTKRPERMLELAPELPWPSNIWVGTSVENSSVQGRIEHLRHAPAAVRFLSIEPLLGPLEALTLSGIHWVIVGGESGPGARPMEESWVRSIRDQCIAEGVPFHFKQWGGINKKKTGRILEGRTWDQLPSEMAA